MLNRTLISMDFCDWSRLRMRVIGGRDKSQFENEPCHEKTCHRDLWPGKTQTGLLSYISRLESWKLEMLYYLGSKNKDTDLTARMRRLICAFVVRIWHKQVSSWWGSNVIGSQQSWSLAAWLDKQYLCKGYKTLNSLYVNMCKFWYIQVCQIFSHFEAHLYVHVLMRLSVYVYVTCNTGRKVLTNL